MITNKPIFALILLQAIILQVCGAADTRWVNSIDTAKIDDAYSSFVQNLFWPSDEEIAGKTINPNTITTDVQQLKSALSTVFKPAFVPSSNDIDHNLIAVERLRNDNDYLLLRYSKNEYDIEIKDAKALYILVLPTAESKPQDLSNLPQYVINIAGLILNIPPSDQSGKQPTLFVSQKDIGNSRLGTITYNDSFPPPKYWYSHIRWWSDGKNILFEIGKAPLQGLDLTKMAAPPRDFMLPRRFKK